MVWTRVPGARRATAGLVAAVMVLAAVVAGAGTASATPEGRRLVDGWYESFLGRSAAADPGSQYWVDRLEVQAPADVLWALTHTREYDTQRVTAYYREHLGRALDPGASYWVDGTTAQRFPLEWALQNILASEEYQRLHPGRRALVIAWYATVLGVDMTPPEIARQDGALRYWEGRIGTVGTLAALREIYYTPQGVARRVTGSYTTLLGRQPRPGELVYWSPKEVESAINVDVLIGATPEYASRLAAQPPVDQGGLTVRAQVVDDPTENGPRQLVVTWTGGASTDVDDYRVTRYGVLRGAVVGGGVTVANMNNLAPSRAEDVYVGGGTYVYTLTSIGPDGKDRGPESARSNPVTLLAPYPSSKPGRPSLASALAVDDGSTSGLGAGDHLELVADESLDRSSVSAGQTLRVSDGKTSGLITLGTNARAHLLPPLFVDGAWILDSRVLQVELTGPLQELSPAGGTVSLPARITAVGPGVRDLDGQGLDLTRGDTSAEAVAVSALVSGEYEQAAYDDFAPPAASAEQDAGSGPALGATSAKFSLAPSPSYSDVSVEDFAVSDPGNAVTGVDVYPKGDVFVDLARPLAEGDTVTLLPGTARTPSGNASPTGIVVTTRGAARIASAALSRFTTNPPVDLVEVTYGIDAVAVAEGAIDQRQFVYDPTPAAPGSGDETTAIGVRPFSSDRYDNRFGISFPPGTVRRGSNTDAVVYRQGTAPELRVKNAYGVDAKSPDSAPVTE